ncbi:VacJ family lipoprotein [Thermodesulfobacteriota bacterium]
MSVFLWLALFCHVLFVFSPQVVAEDIPSGDESVEYDDLPPDLDEFDIDDMEDSPSGWVDPLEPVNRVFFYINDTLYSWVLEPVAEGYGAVLPKEIRIGIRNLFSHILTPVRVVGSLLQGKVTDSGVEVTRFVVNTFFGFGGFFDVAEDAFDLRIRDEDLGQALGYYGVSDSIYIFWPILGPSNLRDTVGLGGEFFLNPIYYIGNDDLLFGLGLKSEEIVNETSLMLGEYDQIKDSSLDPYVSIRDFYLQYRRGKVKE